MAGSLVPQVLWGLRPLERIPNRSFLLTPHPCSLGSTQVVKGHLNPPWDLILTTGTASLGCTLSLSDLSVEKSIPYMVLSRGACGTGLRFPDLQPDWFPSCTNFLLVRLDLHSVYPQVSLPRLILLLWNFLPGTNHLVL